MRLFINNLASMDISRLDPTLGLVGETWLVDASLMGRLNVQEMILDFSEAKQWIKQVIDQQFDHRLLVPAKSTHCQVQHSDEDSLEIRFRLENHTLIVHRSPATAVALLDTEAVHPNSVAHILSETLSVRRPDNVDELTITLRKESQPGRYIRYSHGLKGYRGHCQRIAHGHRSRIEILRDGIPDSTLEKQWVTLLGDRYLSCRDNLLGETKQAKEVYYRFGYHAQEGRFELELPRALCCLFDRETTVEHLTSYIANQLKENHPNQQFQVRLFEGVNKGAICES